MRVMDIFNVNMQHNTQNTLVSSNDPVIKYWFA